MDTASKRRQDDLKNASKKVVHKSFETTVEFIGKKTDDKIVKQNLYLLKLTIEKFNVEKLVILTEKRQEILNELRKSIIK